MKKRIIRCNNCGKMLKEYKQEDSCAYCGRFYIKKSNFFDVYEIFCIDGEHYCSEECLKKSIINNSKTTAEVVAEKL